MHAVLATSRAGGVDIADRMMSMVLSDALARGWTASEVVDVVRTAVSAWAALLAVGYLGDPNPVRHLEHRVFDGWRRATSLDLQHAFTEAVTAAEVIARLPAIRARRCFAG